jgi:hypothetical protein
LHIESSEFLRAHHGDQQVAEQRERDGANDDVFHKLSGLLAPQIHDGQLPFHAASLAQSP